MSLSEALPTTAIDTVSERLAQGPYMAARAGFVPMHDPPVERRRLHQCANMPRMYTYALRVYIYMYA